MLMCENSRKKNTRMMKSILVLSLISTGILSSTSVFAASCKIPKSYYKNVTCTSDSRYFLAVKDSGQPVALINKQGKKTADLFAYQHVLPKKMRDGLLPVKKNGRVGYINGKGVVAIPVMYDSLGGKNWARGFNNSRVVVRKKGKWGVVNTANDVIVPFSSKISRISDFSRGKSELVKSGITYRVDTRGNMQKLQGNGNHTDLARQNTEVILSDDRINQLLVNYQLVPSVKSDSNQKLVNQQSNQTSPNDSLLISKSLTSKTSQPNTIDTTSDPLQQIAKINQTSMLKAEAKKESISDQRMPIKSVNKGADNQTDELINSIEALISDDTGVKLFAKQSSEGKWGFDDINNINMITYSFDQVMPYSEGLAGVKMANNWGFINKAGDLVINFRFSDEGVRLSPTDNYHGLPPFVFYKNKAWIGGLRDGTKLCIDKQGVNVSCDK